MLMIIDGQILDVWKLQWEREGMDLKYLVMDSLYVRQEHWIVDFVARAGWLASLDLLHR